MTTLQTTIMMLKGLVLAIPGGHSQLHVSQLAPGNQEMGPSTPRCCTMVVKKREIWP